VTAFSPEIDRALVLAACAHRSQLRKGSDVPYIAHPAAVALLLQRCGFPDHVVIAGILHDVVEDTHVSLAEVEAQFGPAVAALVAAVTEQKREPDAGGGAVERPWRVRKQEALVHLARSGPTVAALKAADALHNCRTTLRDLELNGRDAWRRFRASAEEQVWYYAAIADHVEALLGEHALARELRDAVRALEAWAPGG
jgi:(p)ppGpp synthase/HD superfamily hydrolase